MDLTYFLAQFFGLMFIILSVAMFLNKSTMLQVFNDFGNNKVVLFITGFLTLILGLAMVLSHNLWSDGTLAFVITLLGWLTLLKGIIFLFLPKGGYEKIYKGLYIGKNYYLITTFLLILGVLLAYFGFA